jgi:hypothetical protein
MAVDLHKVKIPTLVERQCYTESAICGIGASETPSTLAG